MSRPDWLELGPDRYAPTDPQPLALFPEPDPCGTPDLFTDDDPERTRP